MLTLRSHLTRWALLASALAMVAVLLVACGDDADEPEATATSTANEAAASATTDATATETPTEAAPTEVTIEHYSGTDTVPVNPETVVVMDLGILLTLDALGVEVDAVGGVGTPIPAEYEALVNNPAYTTVGTAFEPDYEAINAMEPDLIIVATRSSATYPEMSKIAPTIDLTGAEGAGALEALTKQVNDLAAIFGAEERATELLADLDEEIAAIQAETADAGTALVVMTNGAEVSAYGPGSFRFGMVHDLFGYAAADDSLERDATHGDVISFEFILEANPDVLFVVDRAAAIGDGSENAEAVLDNELVRQTTAWQDERVVYVDNFSWYIAFNSLPAMFDIIEDIRTSIS